MRIFIFIINILIATIGCENKTINTKPQKNQYNVLDENKISNLEESFYSKSTEKLIDISVDISEIKTNQVNLIKINPENSEVDKPIEQNMNSTIDSSNLLIKPDTSLNRVLKQGKDLGKQSNLGNLNMENVDNLEQKEKKPASDNNPPYKKEDNSVAGSPIIPNNDISKDNKVNSKSYKEKEIFEKYFEGVVGKRYLENEYISFDNKKKANSARLIVPRNKNFKNIYSLLDQLVDFKKLFIAIRDEMNNGMQIHNSVLDKKDNGVKIPLDLIVINTNKCASIPNILHIQMYGGTEIVPYNSPQNSILKEIRLENRNFQIKKMQINSMYNSNYTTKIIEANIILMKNTDKRNLSNTFDSFFSKIEDSDFLNDYIEVLKWFRDNHPSIRSFFVINKGNNPNLTKYQLESNQFFQLVYTFNSVPGYMKFFENEN